MSLPSCPLSDLELDQISDHALHVARTGAEIVLRYFQTGTDIRRKSLNDQVRTYDLVTDADVESEKAIVEQIKSRFPDHQVLGEELAQAEIDSPQLWVVDPLDGTNNFAHGIPHWAVSIAYYHLGQPICGVIYNPVRDDLFQACVGRGATYNGQPIHVNDQQALTESLIGAGFYYDRGVKMEATLAAIGDLFRAHIHGIRRFGTAALDLCQVALGWYGGFFEYELAPWDIGAGRIVVEEAGGKITDCLGNSLSLGRSSILASNGVLHESLLEIVRRNFPAENAG